MNGDDEPGGLAQRRGLGRDVSLQSLAARREAAERRLSSAVRQAELIDGAVRMLDEQLTEFGVPDDNGSLHATARALLTVACGTEAYDVTFLPKSGHPAVRVRHSAFGLEAEVLGRPAPSPLSSALGESPVLSTGRPAASSDVSAGEDPAARYTS